MPPTEVPNTTTQYTPWASVGTARWTVAVWSASSLTLVVSEATTGAPAEQGPRSSAVTWVSTVRGGGVAPLTPVS
jgi:hypothetical protein